MLRRYIPKNLYARIILIVILPIFVTMSLMTYIFFARHWDQVTANLSENVAGQIALVTELYAAAPDQRARNKITDMAAQKLGIRVSHAPGVTLPDANQLSPFNVYNIVLDRRLSFVIDQPYWMNTQTWPDEVEIRVALDDGVLIYFAKRDRVFANTGRIFLFWLITSSVLLGWIAIFFMRHQVRSILRLASAAEAFGRGRDTPDFRPAGATEVRKAGYAFIGMRERIKRHLEQRTSMLAGISHDLRTPLTRIKLALAMLPKSQETQEIQHDADEMERMLEAYLDFARNEAVDEDPTVFCLSDLVSEIEDNVHRTGRTIETTIPDEIDITARRDALKRAISNLTSNALRFADHVWINARRSDRYLEIHVDDDGPGIDPLYYEDVFKPFMRLDQARNLNKSGVGMGLTIVRDIARAHGGDVSLYQSDRGGLRASIRLPL